VLGCGFTGSAAARLALDQGRRVIGTVRHGNDPGRSVPPEIELTVASTLTPDLMDAIVPPGAEVLVTFPPDGVTDARIAPCLGRARSIVYISTTGVYGDHRGHVDEETPVDPSSARAASRLEAERVWRAVGAVVLRAAGIYGPGRGLHRRLLAGTYRVPGDGGRVVSRVHVEDLARIALAALERGAAGDVFVVADDTPVPQIVAVRGLCAMLGVEVPASVPLEEAAETLRHDRAVDNRRVRERLGVTLRFPSWREGFAHCLAVERGDQRAGG
jgi:nucleoside-diphosphate-sugar epimerase